MVWESEPWPMLPAILYSDRRFPFDKLTVIQSPGQDSPIPTQTHRVIPRHADNVQSKPDHLMLLSADSLRLNELLQPRQANMQVFCTTYFYDYDSTRCRNEVHSLHVELVCGHTRPAEV
jgi:hypothetical protein